MKEIIYRIPYMGSKQKIVKKIYEAINNDIGNRKDLFSKTNINTIYDLFTGGGSVGYYFYNQGWQVYMNDIHKPLIELHEVLNMKNSPLTKELLYKWISREEFNELKDKQDWYGELIRCCWSFGNSGRGYLFGKDIENYKKQGHFIVVNKCFNAGKDFFELIGKQDDWSNFSKIYDIKEQKERRLFLRNYILKNKINNVAESSGSQLYRLQHLERIKQIEKIIENNNMNKIKILEHLQHNITFTSKNYCEFDFEPNSIVYCDPPYLETTGYNNKTFDFDKFDNWVREMKNKNIKVYISEYTNHNNEWREVESFDKYSLFNNSSSQKKLKQEKIFCNI